MTKTFNLLWNLFCLSFNGVYPPQLHAEDSMEDLKGWCCLQTFLWTTPDRPAPTTSLCRHSLVSAILMTEHAQDGKVWLGHRGEQLLRVFISTPQWCLASLRFSRQRWMTQWSCLMEPMRILACSAPWPAHIQVSFLNTDDSPPNSVSII